MQHGNHHDYSHEIKWRLILTILRNCLVNRGFEGTKVYITGFWITFSWARGRCARSSHIKLFQLWYWFQTRRNGLVFLWFILYRLLIGDIKKDGSCNYKLNTSEYAMHRAAQTNNFRLALTFACFLWFFWGTSIFTSS